MVLEMLEKGSEFSTSMNIDTLVATTRFDCTDSVMLALAREKCAPATLPAVQQLAARKSLLRQPLIDLIVIATMTAIPSQRVVKEEQLSASLCPEQI